MAIVDGRDHRRGIGFTEQDDQLVRMKISHDYPACALFRGGKCTCDEADNPPMPQTSKEKQKAFRARQAMLGHTEVRGIYAPPSLHAAIKEAARKIVEKRGPLEDSGSVRS